MQTSRAILNERTKKEPSTYHKICTYEHPVPYFESERVHGYEFTHMKRVPQQLIFNKQEVRPTPISLPTPPASPEFYGTSLQKWYQKKPLFTLTAKGQVKRLEKYLQIQRTLEMCKREHEFQVHTQNMKEAYVDFEFREHQPLLYEDKDVCCICPCNSSKNYDVDFIPVDYLTCSPPGPKFCVCPNDEDVEEQDLKIKSFRPVRLKRKTPYSAGKPIVVPDVSSYYPSEQETSDGQYSSGRSASGKLIDEENIVPTKVVKEGQEDMDDHGIFKVVVKNKEKRQTSDSKYVVQLFDNKNYEANESAFFQTDQPNPFLHISSSNDSSPSDFVMSKITLDHVASLPFDGVDERFLRTSSSGCFLRRSEGSDSVRYNVCSSAVLKNASPTKKHLYKQKYDENKNEIF